MKRKDTRIELVAELEHIQNKTDLINLIIAEAKAGEYHDFKNKKYACGKVALVNLLRQAKLDDLSERVINGEFDETPDPDDISHLKSFTPKTLWPVVGLKDEH